MIYHSHIQITWIPNKSFIIYINLSIHSLHVDLHLSSFHLCLSLQTLVSSLHLHLQAQYHFIYLVLVVLEIRINAFTFMFLQTSRKHNFTYGSLILLQPPLHSLILTL